MPRNPTDYTRKLAWIDKTSFLPLKEEYYDAQDQLARVVTADKVEIVGADGGPGRSTYPTVTRRTMKNIKTGHRTEVSFASVAYDVGLEDELFTERSLEAPRQKWVQ